MAIIVQSPAFVPEMRGKVIELVGRVDEYCPLVDKTEGLTFLPPRGVALDVCNYRSLPADDVSVLEGEERLANMLGKCEDAMFQTVGTWNALSEATHEPVTCRILVHDAHSPLLKKDKSLGQIGVSMGVLTLIMCMTLVIGGLFGSQAVCA